MRLNWLRIPALVTQWLIRGYQQWLSPLFPPTCRYTPTCSQYAMEAISRYGLVQGGWLALRRLMRCHPFGGWGVDPVPERRCCASINLHPHQDETQ
ncbi:MAG: membrane protein insertion efficiency factor YidD [Candidatus Dadabacteria bacterium]|nr:MAG: membrane protein insertion efficiency factor YidD [Candidatus Dadabacteria bacterium]